MGNVGDESVPTSGDMLHEVAGCVVSYESGHGYFFNSSGGNELISDQKSAQDRLQKFCNSPANRYATIVKRNPDTGSEIVLETAKLHKSDAGLQSRFMVPFSWGLAAVGVGLALMLGYQQMYSAPSDPRTWQRSHRRRLHFAR